MTTFDEILPVIREVLGTLTEALKKLEPVILNRDLNGRIRLILDEKLQDQPETRGAVETIVHALEKRLGPHTFPAERMVLFEPSLEMVKQGALHFPLQGFDAVTVVDRLATETDWARIEPVSSGASRIVFFSIKGGVGRSTASAVAAWSLAQSGKRVMVLDLDLESPGISTSLLPDERRPAYGITDWLVEDLVGNGAVVFEDMVTKSDLSHDGDIYVVPAHGRNPGEYVAKLGRVWMPGMDGEGLREPWAGRLARLLTALENRWQPDVILMDARAGIDEVASACITDLGAKGILLFSIDGEQAWSGYRILFQHWLRTGVAHEIRERLQMVGAMIPELNAKEYFDGLREHSWITFAEELYDEIPAGEPADTYFSFDQADETAPHFPWPIRWHRGFAALQSIHSRFQGMGKDEVKAVFGPLLRGIDAIIGFDGESHE
jgi:hypothetical protein